MTTATAIPNLVSKFEQYVQDHIQVYPQHKNRASSAGHPCERHLVYCRLNSGEKLKHDVGLELIFREGNHQEKSFIRDFMAAGIFIEESQRSFEWPEFELTGKIDGTLRDGDKKYPVEFKSMSPANFDKLNNSEDLKNSFTYYVKGYYDQIQLYLLMNNCDEGIIFLKNKVTGRIKQINIALDYTYSEAILKKLERVNASVKAKTYPERVEDRKPCQSCSFRHICLPDEAAASLVIEDSVELLDTLEQREKLKAAAKQFEELDEKAKSMCKVKEDGAYLVGGDFQVKVKTQERTSYVVPAEIKDKYAEKKPVTIVTITALKK
jgi:CRISPR/Cas system-associated exonuclease Cas4 (RecB family)